VTVARRAGISARAAADPVPPAGRAVADPARLGFPEAVGERVLWRIGPLVSEHAEGRPDRDLTDAELDPGSRALAAGDTLGAWVARIEDSGVPALALREYGRVCVALGLTARADSLLASLQLALSPWAWDALRLRSNLALARGDTLRADSLLAGTPEYRWPDADRAALLLGRARLAAARRDAGACEDLARQVIRAFPALGPAGPALALLDSLAAARGDSLAFADERTGAEVDYFRGARAVAVRRLRHARPRAEAGDRWALALRLAEVLRESRLPLSARAAAESALALAPEGEPRAKAALERARAIRDAGAVDSALAAYARVGRSAVSPSLRATAWWEYAREAEDASRWREALEGFRRVSESGDRRADDARLRAGLVQLARGEPDSARAWLRRSSSEAARFWNGVALRARDRAAGDSLLADLAVLPGYSFYRAAARDTLGLAGWRHAVAASDPHSTLDEAPTWSAGSGLADDVLRDLGAKLAADRPEPARWLDAASAAYRLGRAAQGTRWAERAFADAAAGPDESLTWAIVPWGYPPAFEPQVVAAESLGVERALLWALIRQESRFDPRARSRSDALGLTQLKLATAGDAAKWLREPVPAESTLFQPGASVRYGARYLAQLLRRFEGVTTVALATYNAGPSTARKDWRALVARGGEALYAEFASNADSQDYVKRILGFRQAYRELRPTAMP
jgi:soluble lytic murein transglycosylase-like protein